MRPEPGSEKMLAAPGIAECQFRGAIYRFGDCRNTIYRVEIRDQWDSQPIVSGDVVIAAEHHTVFPWLTGTKLGVAMLRTRWTGKWRRDRWG